MDNLKKIKNNTYEFKVENMTVEMIYPKSSKNLNECLLNILKSKIEKG